MAKPKKKKKYNRAIKSNLIYDPTRWADGSSKTQFPDGAGLLEKDVKDYLEKTKSNFDGTLKPAPESDPSEFFPPMATGAITPDNNPAQLLMPWGKALKYLHQYKKSLSAPAFDLIKKKAKEGVLSYGLFAEILEQAAEFSFDKHMSSKDEKETPPKLYKGGSVKPIKKSNPKLNKGGSVRPTKGGEDPIITEGVASLQLKTINDKMVKDPGNTDYQKELDDFKQWYGNYILSDTYRDRLRSSGDYGTEEDMDKVTQLRYDALQNLTLRVNPSNPARSYTSYIDLKKNEINLLTNTRMTKDNALSILGHEAGHTVGAHFDQYWDGDPKGQRMELRNRALSMNDILDLESRNQQYRDAPNISVTDQMYRTDSMGNVTEDQMIYPSYSGGDPNNLKEGTLAASYYENPVYGGGYPNITTMFKGSPTLFPERQNYNWVDSNLSNEEVAREMYKFPEGYPEDLKQQELKKIATYIGNQRRDLKTQSDIKKRKKELRNQIRSEYDGEYGDLPVKDIIKFRVEDDFDNIDANVLKSLPRKYRKMRVDEIPDGVSPEIDAYRKSKKLQEEYMDNQKRAKDLDFDYNKNINLASYTPEGGDDLVIKSGRIHEIGAIESGADLVGMRMHLYKKYGWSPEDNITQEQWQQVVRDQKNIKGETVEKRFMRKYKDQDATYILNNIAMEDLPQGDDRMAKHGASLRKKRVKLIKRK